MTFVLVDTVRVAGFRGIKNLEMAMPRVTVLIGANNSGKTSLLKALQMALGDYSRYITEEDFYIGPDEKRVTEIKVDVRFVPTDANGNRIAVFDEAWQTEFGDKIKAEANGNQFFATRTSAKPNEIKGGFECVRFTLQTWPEFAAWQEEKVKEKDKINKVLSTPFVSIEAQRDIHHELKDKSSFAGKVLAGVEYAKEDIVEIERLINELNVNAINKSDALKNFKTHLEKLNQSFQGAGNVEITPFPKKIRDLSKHFSVHFGEGSSGTFSMEYHGMGTRSWASMLTVKAFIEAQVEKHKPIQVLASAGAGKTRVLTERIGHILKNTKKDGIIALTFTNKAAEEMQSRLEGIDEVESRCWISTIHGIAQRILEQYGNTIGLADDPNPYALTLSTIHTMKGLEKDIVFLTSMCEGVFPDYRANTKKEIDEERNSAFVAVTRARRWIFITFPQQRKMPWGDVRTQSPSRFLQEMNAV